MEAGAMITLFASLGFGAGALHFALLHHGVGQLVSGGSAVGAVATTLGRFAITVASSFWLPCFTGWRWCGCWRVLSWRGS
jgi:hypothetical protein